MANHVVILSVYILTFLIGLPANILSLCAFSVNVRSKATPTNILLLNLTVSDLLFLLFLPLKMHEAASGMRWDLPYFLCSVTSFFFFSTIYTSSLLLMAVSVDRYLGVAFPIRYKLLRKPVYGALGGAFAFLLGSANCSFIFLTQHLLPGNTPGNTSVCYDNFTPRQLEVLLPVRLYFFFVLFLVALLVSTFCYLSCIRLLYARPRICSRKRQKAVGMALGTLLVFVVCFLPYNLSHLLGYLQGDSPSWRYYTLLLSTANTCLDPIIFYFSSSTFQATIKHSLYRLMGRRHQPKANEGSNLSKGG
ncbi:free fatty acid receptor 2-like [Conger conger]|uniref:free fatty acid receptor 2-like n=1 Tax=Conger conger TaxID=82655 RepID=UPI002A5AC14E|nr:free fatty acid receptor 2-like [Conger conger]XP_061114760.1 free fatty acid receptor 2-like [Conger conger]